MTITELKHEMTIRELREFASNKGLDIEVYISLKNERNYHTDAVELSYDLTESNEGFDSGEFEVLDYEVMDAERYDETLYANCSVSAVDEEFEDVLVVLVKRK